MLLIISLVFVLFGSVSDQPEAIALGAMIYFFLYPVLQYHREGTHSINPLTVFSFIKGIVSLGNFIAVGFADDSEIHAMYYKYVSEEHIVLALLLHYFGSLLILFGFEYALKREVRLPKLQYIISSDQLARFPLIIAIILIIQFTNVMGSLGGLNSFFVRLPMALVFFISRYGAQTNQTRFIRLSFLLMVITTVQGFLFGFLRLEIVLPAISFVLGMMVGSNSIKVLRQPIFIPIYFGLFVFISYFTFLGETRGKVSQGFDKISELQQYKEAMEKEENNQDENSTFLSRFSNINQLSQIGNIVEKDGFYEGKTLNYLLFGFIPRFIWPEKPIIQQGGWFAYRIGMGRVVDNRYTNSIDMTPMGELYLNFGWLGVISGCLLLGFFMGSLWQTSNFWQSEKNLLGSLFGFYMFYLGLISFGSDLQIILTTISTYLLFLAMNKAVGQGIQDKHNLPLTNTI